MLREFSAGGVVVRRLRGDWVMAAIRPAGRSPGTWVLPKGALEPGETTVEAALREIAEETGLRGRALERLGEERYWYSRGGERVFKVVAVYLVRYVGGRIDRLPEASRHEVAEARWLPLAEAPELLAHASERELARRAGDLLAGGGDV